jgi:hypothetical protein
MTMPDAPITRREAFDRVTRARERVAAAQLLAEAAQAELVRAESALATAIPDATMLADDPAAVPRDTRPAAASGELREALGPGPADWRRRRTSTTWAVSLVALAVSLLLHWIAQMAFGAVAGAMIGIEGFANITERDLETMQIMTLASTLTLTVIAIGWCGLLSYERLSWPPAIGDYGMNWWRYCFAPVLGLTLVHGVVFALLMFDAARP